MLSLFDLSLPMFAFHDGGRGGQGNIAGLFIFIGVLATAGWLIFSELEWRYTVLTTIAGWAVLLGLTFGM